jgi:hypothetical protein
VTFRRHNLSLRRLPDPILRCHGCFGGDEPGIRLVGVAVAPAPDCEELYVVGPDGFVRLDAGQVREMYEALATLLTDATPAPPPCNGDAAGTAR